MSLLDILFGRPLSSHEERAEKIGPIAGIPICGLDALSSAAYGPEAALTTVDPSRSCGVAYILPVSGFERDGASLVPGATEQTVVSRMCLYRSKGMTFRRIAEMLNVEYVPTKRRG